MTEAEEKLEAALATISGAPSSGYYQHRNSGGLYWFSAPALHSESLAPLAVYQSLSIKHLGVNWARPLDMFLEATRFVRLTREEYVRERLQRGYGEE